MHPGLPILSDTTPDAGPTQSVAEDERMLVYKLVAISVNLVIIVYFETLVVAEHREQRRREEARLAKLEALGFQPRRDQRPGRIDW
jgi:hypothetical protein